MLKITQKLFPFITVTVDVNEERELTYSRKTLFKSTSMVFPIDQLSSKPTLHKHLNISWLGMLLIGLILTIYCVYLLVNTGSENAVGGIAAFVGLLIISAYKVHQSFVNLLIFNDKRTREPLFTLKPNKPSIEIVNNFVNSLEKRIKSIEYSSNYSADEMAIIYKKHLEFLLNENVITEREYESISDRISNKNTNNVLSLVK